MDLSSAESRTRFNPGKFLPSRSEDVGAYMSRHGWDGVMTHVHSQCYRIPKLPSVPDGRYQSRGPTDGLVLASLPIPSHSQAPLVFRGRDYQSESGRKDKNFYCRGDVSGGGFRAATSPPLNFR
ncbi:hypothetical protein Bbelb_358220 [Branchiostoma belcheri]|nr:hypothetical protein Bbelb_358220 [Branchiostoma belcheri]